MNKLESLKSTIKYYVHYRFNENDTLDSILISHHETVFAEENQILELSFDQFSKFPLNHGVHVDWSHEVMTPNQWVEYWKEANRI